jgi:hypothetical protein
MAMDEIGQRYLLLLLLLLALRLRRHLPAGRDRGAAGALPRLPGLSAV